MFWVKLLMNKNIFHILVVDDDDRIRELVKEYLVENNFLVTTAKDAFDAKKKLEIIKFDILVLDIMMPGESGLSLTKEIKKNRPTPIILLTAKGEAQDRIEGLELGADDYLGKPFEPKELLLRIKNILNKIKKPILSDKIYIGNTLVDLKKLNIKNIYVFGRNRKKIKFFSKKLNCVVYSDKFNNSHKKLFLVNCTPIGMSGAKLSTAIPFSKKLIKKSDIVMDLVNFPINTKFIKLAKKLKKKTISGNQVSLYQIKHQFKKKI